MLATNDRSVPTLWFGLLATLAACDTGSFEGPLGTDADPETVETIPSGTEQPSEPVTGTGTPVEPVALDCTTGIPGVGIDGIFHSVLLQDALDAAPAGATVELCGGAYLGTYVARRPVNLIGAGLDETVLESVVGGTVLTLQAGSTVSGMTISGGDAALGGGLHLVGEGSFTVEDCLVRDNLAETGGGIAIDGGANVSIIGTTITGNGAGQGGGLSVGPGATAQLADSVIVGNLSDGSGGGVWLDGGALYGGEVIDNAAAEGGGIAASGASTVEGTEIVANHANSGAGLHVVGGPMVLADLGVEHNSGGPGSVGGGLVCDHAEVALYGTVLTRNSAAEGGGVRAEGCTISGGTITANDATGNGGGAVLLWSTLFQSTVSENLSGGNASGVWLRGSGALVESRVEHQGGVAAIEAGPDSRIIGGAIVDNDTCAVAVTAQVTLDGASILRNETGACFGAESNLFPSLTSIASDWGNGADDNTVDLRWDEVYTDYGSDASFACADGCEPTP